MKYFKKKYNITKFRKVFSNIIKKEFNNEPAHNKNHLKALQKSYNEKINANDSSQCIYILVILIDSVYIKHKNYYPQVILEKHKHVI